MLRCSFLALVAGMLVLTGGLVGQDNKPEPKKDVKAKDNPPARLKGRLPANWSRIGLTDAQVQEIYRTQNKYNDEIDKLTKRINELKATRDKEMKAVLTPDQKKRLDEILTGKGK